MLAYFFNKKGVIIIYQKIMYDKTVPNTSIKFNIVSLILFICQYFCIWF